MLGVRAANDCLARLSRFAAAVAEQLQSSGVPDPVFAQQLGALIGGDPMAPGGFLGNAAGAGGGASVPDELAYSKKPRPVQYKWVAARATRAGGCARTRLAAAPLTLACMGVCTCTSTGTREPAAHMDVSQ